MAPDDMDEAKRTPRCPICRRPTEQDFRPFCSRRCADIDLSRWLGGTYAVAGSVDDDEDGAELDSTSDGAEPGSSLHKSSRH